MGMIFKIQKTVVLLFKKNIFNLATIEEYLPLKLLHKHKQMTFATSSHNDSE